MLKFFVRVLLALVPVAGLCADPVMPIPQPGFVPGEAWTMRETNILKPDQIRRVTHTIVRSDERQTVLHERVLTSGAEREVVADSSTFMIVESTVVEGRDQRFRFPLKQGDSWTYKFRKILPSGMDLHYWRTATPVKWESITVPAGQFEALRIVHKGDLESTMNGSARSGTELIEYWYVPSVKQAVRYEYKLIDERGQINAHTVRELESFNLKTPSP